MFAADAGLWPAAPGSEMLNALVAEAAAVGLKEALKLSALWWVVRSYAGMDYASRRSLMRGFYVAVALSPLLMFASLLAGSGPEVRDALSRLIGYVFFLCFGGSVLVLLRAPEASLPQSRWASVAVALASLLYFAPDIAASTLYLREAASLKQSALGVYLSAGAAFAAPLLLLWAVARMVPLLPERMFGPGQVLLFLALVKLMAGGTGGFAEFSLVGSVQHGVMKLVHDVIHQMFVAFMVPDHPIFRLDVWKLIGLLFGPGFSMFVALCMLVAPLLWSAYAMYVSPVDAPEGADTGAERRKHRQSVMAGRRLRAVPVLAFTIVVMALWYTGRADDGVSVSVPRPRPLVEDKGMVLIPMNEPGMDLRDGGLHKFSLMLDEKEVGLLVMQRPDGKLAVCLDACEICPPEGYGVSGSNVVCIYCMTPIPVSTLGEPGGCNPVPLNAVITDAFVRIDTEKIRAMWSKVMSGESKEPAR